MQLNSVWGLIKLDILLDTATGRFLSPDSVNYLGANGDLNSYNLYAYCSNNPIMYVDPMGNAAIYAVAYGFDDGLIIVGHAMFYYQDSDGVWWYTEFTGQGLDKSKAKVLNYKINKGRNYILEKLKGKYTYTYLDGDYSMAQEYALKHKGINYGGYNLFKNNCLHYVHDTINYAQYGDDQKLYNKMNTIIPALYKPADKRSNFLPTQILLNRTARFSMISIRD